MKNFINLTYASKLQEILALGEVVETRNHSCYKFPFLTDIYTDQIPLITTRKTAWKKALREMEWFMSGDDKCPEELLDWWSGQLNPEGKYINGYATQLRNSTYYKEDWFASSVFDQISYILDGLKKHKNSRRLIMSTWNTGEMANITEVNQNHQTPTTCHGTLTQFHYFKGKLNITTFFRSSDMLLGIPHNLIQYWALLHYFAFHSGLEVGGVLYKFGDSHIYNDPSHTDKVEEIIKATTNVNQVYDDLKLVYNYSGQIDSYGTPKFLSDDFTIDGEIPKPVVLGRPKLF